MKILGIESSCDETAASVVEGKRNEVTILSNVISSQIEIHKKYGGVVPEVAAREHILNILPVVNEAMEIAKTKSKDIDAISVSRGPGLVSSLIIGIETAKNLAFAWNKPVIGINHVEGHIYANFIGNPKIEFPAVILTVSGGHTMLVLMKGHGEYKTLGETRDDAAGEAYDKAAKLLGLGYPGGKEVDMKALKAKNDHGIKLPRPMIDAPNFDFSFSGLKTALLYKIQKDKSWKKKIPEYCLEFQSAVIDVLVKKTIKASLKNKVKTVMLTGGVAASRKLRSRLQEEAEKNNLEFFMPELCYTTDNAAMVASAGYYHVKRKDFTPWKKLKVDCNLEFK